MPHYVFLDRGKASVDSEYKGKGSAQTLSFPFHFIRPHAHAIRKKVNFMSFIPVFLLGIGLAIDASCVCTCNGLVYRPNWPTTLRIALPFALFQGIMPLIGYFGIGLLPSAIFAYQPFIALILLCAVGIKMIVDAIQHIRHKERCPENTEETPRTLTIKIMFVQALSTSIDALSVGASYASEAFSFMLFAVCLIASITFFMCILAVRVGIQIGTRLNNKAEVFGGFVLILLGIYLFMEGL